VAEFVGIRAAMTRKGGWTRAGSRGRFRYLDSRGRRITDPDKLERIEALAIPPAWKEVRISPRPTAKVQATGTDAAGRTQYRYHDDYRAAQEEAKFDKLVRFAATLPAFREAMSEHMELEQMSPEWTCAVAVRLVNLGWFRAGEDRYAKAHKTFGITTLRKSHVQVRGSRISFRFRGKQRIWVRTAVVDSEIADAMRELLRTRGRRLFRYRLEGETYNLTARKLNDYIREFMGEEFTAKDFRTWGGTLIAAVALAERGPAENEAEAKRAVVGVMRTVGERLGNTPAVARASYVSPAVVEQYLDGRTIDDFRARHLRVVGARELGLNLEELGVLSLLRSWRIRRARKAA
jgi:DNA topoisomerase-1